MSAGVRIGYYGTWSAGRGCNALEPEGIPAGVLTHINVAFEYMSADHKITDNSGPVVGRVSRLKNFYPGLKVVIALGDGHLTMRQHRLDFPIWLPRKITERSLSSP